MTIPSTGTTWKEGGFADVDNRFNNRGGLAAALIRDNRGIATDISPYAAGSPPTAKWSPFALDGSLRDDLFAWVRVDGVWQANPDMNEGWFLIGAFDEKGGPDRKPAIKHDDQMILQSNFPFDTDLTGEGLTIQFTAVEVLKPLLRRLRMNLPLSDESGNSIVEMPGQSNYITSKPVDADTIDRQLVLLFAHKRAGQYVFTCEAYPLVKLTDIGNFKRDKVTPDAASLTWTVLPDSFHVDIDATNPASQVLIPALYSEFVGGDGWTAIGGNPVFPGSAPHATALTATTAEIEFQGAVATDAVTYTAEKNVAGTWSSATIGSVNLNQPTEGDVTLNITGLTTATACTFRVTATGTNSLTAVSQTSNSITTP